MESVKTVNLDNIFKCLRENKPITTDLIKQSSVEYENLKKLLREKNENKNVDKQASSTRGGEDRCPHCNKNIPKNNGETAEKLHQELDRKNKQCRELEQQINQMKQEQISPGIFPLSSRVEQSHLNRVQHVAERYEALYENDWTNAFKFLDTTMNLREDKVLDTLLRILRAAYSFCNDIARAQMTNMEGELYCPLSTWTEDARVDFIGRKLSLPMKSARLAQYYRKSTSNECVPAIQNSFIAQILPEFMDPSLYNNRQVMNYVKKSVELSWYMVIQETPMVLVSKVDRNSNFDTSLFRFYSYHGDKFDFVVWPTLLMYSEGPVIIKGFAQAIDSNRSLPSVRDVSETVRVPPKAFDDIGETRGDLNQGVTGGTPWGSNVHSSAGTPSVDLPPLPAGNVSPTRYSPNHRDATPQGVPQLTAAWKGKKKPKTKP